MPAISEFLTPLPLTIQTEENLSQARKLMANHHIRHLPVCRNEQLVGVISERDLFMAMGITDFDWRIQPARLGMEPNPLIVSLDADARNVAESMISGKRDCALVEDAAGRLVGIFTEMDALKAMATLLKDGPKPA